ncbi:MAG: hypothetical protein ACRDGB_05715 [Candidatus Limnocylindria bacterium]
MPLAAGIIVGWDKTAASIPTGWPRETSLDARFVKMVPNATTDPGGTGGSNTHDHPFPAHTHTGPSHSHASGNTGTKTADASDADTGTAPGTHSHTTSTGAAAIPTSASGGPANFDSTNGEPPWLEVIFIKSDGTQAGLPDGCIAYFNGAAPTGWTAHAASANRFWKGAPALGNGGSTGGTGNAHGHTSASHTHGSGGTHSHTMSVGGASGDALSFLGAAVGPSSHAHTLADTGTAAPTFESASAATTANGDSQPPWHKLLPIENTSGGDSLTNGLICLWTGTLASIPSGWRLCDGAAGAPNLLDRFVKGAADSLEVGATGGATTHTHASGASHTHLTAAHAHTRPADTGIAGATHNRDLNTGKSWTSAHSHTVGGSTSTDGSAASGGTGAAATANTSNDPVFTTVAFIQFNDQPPDAPTMTAPLAGTAHSGSVTVAATVTDPDGDNVFATFEYDRNDDSWTTIGAGSTVASGGSSSRQWDISEVAPGFSYRVRAKATDVPGLTGPNSAPTGTFIIGPGYQSIYADAATDFFGAVDDVERFYAESLTDEYAAEKT